MISFTKMHGLGNDYVIIDATRQAIDEADIPGLARQMSDRHNGVGADGLILITPGIPPASGPISGGGGGGDLRMRIFNADGSEAEMCGNGIRCVCKYAHDHELCPNNPLHISTATRMHTLRYSLGDDHRVDLITVSMEPPDMKPEDIPVSLSGSPESIIDLPLSPHISLESFADHIQACGLDSRMTCLSMGNPHLILYCDQVDAVPLATLGPFLETQSIFPEGINVSFVQVNSPTQITMRTWERGSGETLACGTGASAACVAGVLTTRTQPNITARLPGGDLMLSWDQSTKHVFMIGPATEVFTGQWNPRINAPRINVPRVPGVG